MAQVLHNISQLKFRHKHTGKLNYNLMQKNSLAATTIRYRGLKR
jgi:hypothetical protein